jgi:hypothetical protein
MLAFESDGFDDGSPQLYLGHVVWKEFDAD